MNRTTATRTVMAFVVVALGAAVLGGCSGSQHTWSDNSSLEPNRMYTCNVPSPTCQVITVVPSNNR